MTDQNQFSGQRCLVGMAFSSIGIDDGAAEEGANPDLASVAVAAAFTSDGAEGAAGTSRAEEALAVLWQKRSSLPSPHSSSELQRHLLKTHFLFSQRNSEEKGDEDEDVHGRREGVAPG